ncbi:hypothetical protein BsWGS_06171 [Bradybaena similaris]
MVHEIEDFYGVYLLYCLNPKFKGRIYIGYTVDPNRRIKQHNTGRHAGGAYKTSGRGPWEMVLIIHGFPNDVSGLRFEWAWQNPDKSRRLRDIPAKTRKESVFQYRWRVVCNMLRTAPWSGLSLTVRWLKQDFRQDFPSGLEPPLHMPVVFGPVVRKKLLKAGINQKKTSSGSASSSQSGAVTSSQSVAVTSPHKKCSANLQALTDEQLLYEEMSDCAVCYKMIQAEDKTLQCLKPDCAMMAHIICLAQSFLGSPSKLLPVQGKCPRCSVNLLWGELVRYRKGCNRYLSVSTLQPSVNFGEDKLSAISESDDSS